jgi:methionyl-tRNA formyltransferase
MRLVFCGTPDFAVPMLEAVLAAGHEVALVLTQPDRPSGRGMQMTASPVKQAAVEHGIPVVQPARLKTNDDLRAQLEAIAPDAILVVAYGRIIPAWMLALPRYGNLNLHGSLLPKYRGAAPIQWAIARGETLTGVTTMRLDEGLDTGDMLLSRSLPVAPDETAADVYPRLAQIGAGLMVETLAGLEAGTIEPQPQEHELATLAPILTRDEGRVDFSRTAQEIYNRWRGFQPWPGAWSMLGTKKLIVTRMTLPLEPPGPVAEFGTLLVRGQRLFASCGGSGWIEIVELQPEGKRSMAAADFLRGAALAEGTRLG